ncbi:MAG: hypothetical protein RL756_1764 [Pseudomonadota bacterium]|jgi:uncharacterized low-complexity protein
MKKLKTGSMAVGAALLGSLALAAPVFACSELEHGFGATAANEADAEGKCGEGKCGEGKCGEGKCGEGKCGSA